MSRAPTFVSSGARAPKKILKYQISVFRFFVARAQKKLCARQFCQFRHHHKATNMHLKRSIIDEDVKRAKCAKSTPTAEEVTMKWLCPEGSVAPERMAELSDRSPMLTEMLEVLGPEQAHLCDPPETDLCPTDESLCEVVSHGRAFGEAAVALVKSTEPANAIAKGVKNRLLPFGGQSDFILEVMIDKGPYPADREQLMHHAQKEMCQNNEDGMIDDQEEMNWPLRSLWKAFSENSPKCTQFEKSLKKWDQAKTALHRVCPYNKICDAYIEFVAFEVWRKARATLV